MHQSDMEEYLTFIQAFADTIANTFKQFSQLCRENLKKTQNSKSEYSELRTQLIEERKKRIELDEKMKQLLSGPTVNAEAVNHEQRKRPKNAFALFVADQRDKILADYPSLSFTKITSLAAIKWKKMAEEQKKVYEKRFEQMSKLYEEQQYMTKNNKILNKSADAHLVKREEGGEERPREAEEEEKYHNDEKNEGNENHGEGEMQNEGQQEIGATMLIQNQEENQATLQMEPEQRQEPKPLEHLLNLFHTPAQNQGLFEENREDKAVEQNLGEVEVEQEPQNLEVIQFPQNSQERELIRKKKSSETEKEESEEKEEKMIILEEKVYVDPSIQIISQVVIYPTIQEQQK